MSRKWIVVGDITTSGGRVVDGSPFTDIDGISVARVGNMATCPLHKGVFPIVDGDATMIVDGQPVALHGSFLACGCKVLAVQQMHVFVDAGGGAGASIRSVQSDAPYRAEGISPNVVQTMTAHGSAFDTTFLVRNKATGEPLQGATYKIRMASGKILEGRTGSDGMTCIAHSDAAEIVSIQVHYRAEVSASENEPTCETCEC